MADCIATLKACQGSSERYPYAINLTDAFSRLWDAEFPYGTGAVVRADGNPSYGREVIASVAGVSGEQEPEWPIGNAETVDDGSVEWTTQPMSNDGLAYRITDCVWAVPTGLTGDSASFTDLPALQEVRIWLTGGTVGRTYVIVGLVSATDGTETATFEVRIQLKIV